MKTFHIALLIIKHFALVTAEVGVEAAFKKFDFTDFRIIPNQKIVCDVAKAFMEAKELAAPSYVGITSKTPPPLFVGIDDEVHYERNLAAYLGSVPLKEKVQKKLDQKRREYVELRNKIFSLPLIHLDDLKLAHESGDLGLGAYLEGLQKLAPAPVIPLRGGSHLHRFTTALNLEKKMDFAAVEYEQNKVIEKLMKEFEVENKK